MKRLLLTIGCIILVVLCPFVGLTSIPLESVLSPGEGSDTAAGTIFWNMRAPRVLLALFTGAALSVGGLVFQGVFRNFLACPFTLGVSSGAAFGAALYFRLGIPFLIGGLSGATLFAFAGALGTVLFVYYCSRAMSAASMLLAGVVMSFFFSSLIVFLQYVSDYQGMFRIMRWLMGGFETVGWSGVMTVIPIVVLGIIVVRIYERDLDLLTLGDDLAASRGTNVQKSRMVLFLATSLMVGAVVSVCGPIGFVGIMVPHACRLVFGSRNSGLSLITALLGGSFLAVCDSVGRIVIPPFEVPVGVITALLGAPFFLWILIRRRNEINLAAVD